MFRIALFLVPLLCLLPIETQAAKKSKPFVVVIDAGHGGKDVGAVDNNVNEKDVNLGVALKLGDLIKKKLKDVKVVYTRDDDSFVSLQGRADIANKAKGDLFISIHTNSLDYSNKNRTSVCGSSVYVLGLHKDKDNGEVARRENAVISLEKNQETYAGFDPNSDESYIIFELAQKGNLNASIKFADEVQKQLIKTAHRSDRGVHQAGFWVLWATSMPAVLVELDFICNPNSARYIASPQGQDQMAKAIFNAVDSYYENSKKSSASVSESAPVTGDYVELPAVVQTEDRELTHMQAPPRQQNTGSKERRRRSASSRKASDNRVVEAHDIKVLSEEKSLAAKQAKAEPQQSTAAAEQVSAKHADSKAERKAKEKVKSDNTKIDKNAEKQKQKELQEALKRQREQAENSKKKARRSRFSEGA